MQPVTPRYWSRRVDLRRLREGDWIIGGSGLVLLIALFLPWYEPGASAWEAFTILDVLLAAGALAAIAVAIVAAAHATPAVPLTMESLVTLLSSPTPCRPIAHRRSVPSRKSLPPVLQTRFYCLILLQNRYATYTRWLTAC